MGVIRVFLIIIFLASSAIAAPDPTGKSGTYTHGSSVTITGTGFGSKTTAAPALFDKVEGTYTTTITDDGIVPVRTAFGGGPQEATAPFQYNADGYNYTRFETTPGSQRHAKSTACYRTVEGGTGGHLGNGEDCPILGGTTSYTYLSWWIKTENDWSEYNNGGTSNKLLRMRDYNYDDATTHTFTWQTSQCYIWSPNTTPCCGSTGCNNGNSGNGATWSAGWHFMEAMFDNTNGSYTLRVDGSTIATVAWTCPFNFNVIWKIGWDANGTVNPSWFDEIYMDNTASRVMIGNASTYAACTHFEMQPATAWATGEITVTLNRGSFGATDTAYIYVFDSASACNSTGLEITFGDTGGATSTSSGVSYSGVSRK